MSDSRNGSVVVEPKNHDPEGDYLQEFLAEAFSAATPEQNEEAWKHLITKSQVQSTSSFIS